MSDLYSRYEIGLRRLTEQIEQDHPLYSEALIFQHRLTENITQSRRYGDIETRKSERSEIIERLNELALSALGRSFNELCGLSTLAMRQQSVAHLEPVENSRRVQIEISLRGNSSTFTPEALFVVLRVLSAVLDIPYDQIRVLGIRGGSIIMQIEIPIQAAQRLIALEEVGDRMIIGLGIQEIRIIREQPSLPIAPTTVPHPSNKLPEDPRYSKIIQELKVLEGGKSSTDPTALRTIIKEMDKLLGRPDSLSNEGETKMSTPEQQFAITVLTQAVSFLFDEARKILTERRQRRQEMQQQNDTVALPSGIKESTKETVLEMKQVSLDEEAQKEIVHLLELIKIYQNQRRNAELTIANIGGLIASTPRERAQLENAENAILMHTQKLKKLLEKVYGQPIHIDGLE